MASIFQFQSLPRHVDKVVLAVILPNLKADLEHDVLLLVLGLRGPGLNLRLLERLVEADKDLVNSLWQQTPALPVTIHAVQGLDHNLVFIKILLEHVSSPRNLPLPSSLPGDVGCLAVTAHHLPLLRHTVDTQRLSQLCAHCTKRLGPASVLSET